MITKVRLRAAAYQDTGWPLIGVVPGLRCDPVPVAAVAVDPEATVIVPPIAQARVRQKGPPGRRPSLVPGMHGAAGSSGSAVACSVLPSWGALGTLVGGAWQGRSI